MPKRETSYFHCRCVICGPLGNRIPLTHQVAHLARCQVEETSSQPPRSQSEDTDLASKVAGLTIADDGIDVNCQPSRLSCSRSEYQQAAEVTRLNLTTQITPDIIPLHAMESTAPIPCLPRLPLLDPRLTKKERRRQTTKALSILRNIRSSLNSCLDSLLGPVTSFNLKVAEGQLATLRLSFEAVTRRVDSVLASKAEIAPLFATIESRIVDIQSSMPEDKCPLEYDSSKCFLHFKI
jgi:hypothetical protein